MRNGKINVVGIVLVLAVIAGGVFLHTFGPYYWDAFSMDEVVKNAALSCQDGTEEKGEKRLIEELYRREIPDYIGEKDCHVQKRTDRCAVHCAWTVVVPWPLIGRERSMSFTADATRGPHGFLD